MIELTAYEQTIVNALQENSNHHVKKAHKKRVDTSPKTICRFCSQRFNNNYIYREHIDRIHYQEHLHEAFRYKQIDPLYYNKLQADYKDIIDWQVDEENNTLWEPQPPPKPQIDETIEPNFIHPFTEFPSIQKIIYTFLLSKTKSTKASYISYKLNLSSKQVHTALKKLFTKGLIEQEQKRHDIYYYA